MTASYILQRLVRVVIIMLAAALINAIREISEKTPNKQGGGNAENTVTTGNTASAGSTVITGNTTNAGSTVITGNTANAGSMINTGNMVNSGGNENNGFIRPQMAMGYGEMKTMKLQSGFSLWILIVSGLVFFIATLFLFIVTVSEGWGIAVGGVLFLEFILLLVFIAAAIFHYYMKKQVIRFSEGCVVVCRPFKADDVIPWVTFGRIEIQAERCTVYDRYGQIRLKVTAGWENYGLFCQMAKRKIEENGGEAVWR